MIRSISNRKTSLALNLNLLIIIVFTWAFFQACRSDSLSNNRDSDTEIWEIELSGNTEGKLQMRLEKKKIGTAKYSISGRLYGTINDYRWGIGEADYKLSGTIENQSIKASFSGLSDMAEGPSGSNGNFSGTLSDSQGSGIWKIIIHARGRSDGTFIMKKIE
ncbi:MAG: hypothetical protein PVG59_19340 [Desulfobacterales bacterium]|jgi:hypothetical protein